LQLTVDAVLRDGDLFGRLLDTFVFGQLRADLQLGFPQPRLYHLRDRNGEHEIDLIAELDSHRLVAIEVKATAAPGVGSARHLNSSAAHLTAELGVTCLWLAKDLMGTDPAPPDARCAVDLDPLERGVTVRTGERPGHLPDSWCTHNSLDSEASRPTHSRVRDDALSGNVKRFDRSSE
jgi:hypothetical protein